MALENGRWVRDVVYDMNHELIAEIFKLWGAIEAENIQFDDHQEDNIVWILESSGQYLARTAYRMQFAGQIESVFPELIWRAWALPSGNFFLRLLLQNRLWTAARLQLRGWQNNYFCALCERNSRDVWHLVALWSACTSLQPSNLEAMNELDDCLSQVIRGGGKRTHSMAIMTLWIIWKQRNAIIFRGARRRTQALLVEIKDLAGCKCFRPLFVVSGISE